MMFQQHQYLLDGRTIIGGSVWRALKVCRSHSQDSIMIIINSILSKGSVGVLLSQPNNMFDQRRHPTISKATWKSARQHNSQKINQFPMSEETLSRRELSRRCNWEWKTKGCEGQCYDTLKWPWNEYPAITLNLLIVMTLETDSVSLSTVEKSY